MTSGSFGMRPRITRTDTSDGNNIIGMKNGRLEIQDTRSFLLYSVFVRSQIYIEKLQQFVIGKRVHIESGIHSPIIAINQFLGLLL